MLHEIEVKVTDLKEGSWIVGRNGSYRIQEMSVWTNQIDGLRSKFVTAEFVSRAKDVMLNAGFRIGFNDMTRLAKAWLEEVERKGDDQDV